MGYWPRVGIINHLTKIYDDEKTLQKTESIVGFGANDNISGPGPRTHCDRYSY